MLKMNAVPTVGIDISKASFDVALLRDECYQLAHFTNNQVGFKKLGKWLKKRQAAGCHMCLEATGRYGQELALFLHEQGWPISVVNPARIKAYAESQLKRNKTDTEDAKVIAHFGATQSPSLWRPPPAEVQALQFLVRRLDSLKSMRTQENNRRQAGLASEAVLTNIEAHLLYLDEQIKAMENQIKDLIDNHPNLRRQRDLLVSIKGISDITAAKFLAEVPDIQQFKSAAQLAAYAGVTPRRKSSGTSVRGKGHLSKMGNSRLRTAFYMPAISAMQWNPLVIPLVERLQKRGKLPKVILGAVMRKLIHLAYGVLKTGKPFDPNYLQNRPVGA
ncbi:MAG TPA: transposase [Anaerolineae bacterium]|nr:transposase [Anaerolineae bacterium]